MDAFNNESMGTDIGFGAHIGKDAWIAQQVTIGQAIDENVAPTLGNNVVIGAVAKLLVM